MPPLAELAFGITAGVRAEAARLGREVERLGFAELWSNDTRGGDGIATLASAVPKTTNLRLAVGVVALSEHDPAAIAARVASHELPRERLILGVGSGASASLELVRSGVADLRERLPGLPIAIAAVGPRMLALAGEVADAVLATWSLPERVPLIRARVEAGAAAAGRMSPPRLVLYVRAAVGPDAEPRIRDEMARYARSPAYARAFAAQPDVPIGATAADARDLPDALRPYREVADTVVVRALPATDDVDGWLGVAAAAVGDGGG